MKRLTMTRLAHARLGSLEFPIEKVEGHPVMFPTLPHPSQAMIGTVVSGHRIRDMMKKERQEGQESSGYTYLHAVSDHC
ncbi:MAG: hypothetical protein A3G87_01520 [Omnitrophica bacterium RIFCSPLOWO2_12_FULL_50_11]|nr:MAG: hypothetical protein A3G87_01520 [Omnitrophica bacterium RIFCSPLOWO2_12_FULL_50_11]